MARKVDMTEAGKVARWKNGQAQGFTWVCSWCWGCQEEFGRCEHCRRFDVRKVTGRVQENTPLPPPFPTPFITFPQGEFLMENRRRAAAGLAPLEPKTQAQKDLLEGRMPKRPGGRLETS